jgi:NAD(P)-dependent dehydrogenase (short-subunit alcohol dehydrogenase family)
MTTPSYLVLGSTGGIGRVHCQRLAKRGASLVLGGRDPEKLDELAARTRGEVCPGDAREATAVDEAVALAVELPFQPPGPFEPAGRTTQLSDRLFICGDHRDLASLQGAMASGRRAAIEVAEALS